MRRRTVLNTAACLAAASILPEAFAHATAAECSAASPVPAPSPPSLPQNYAARGVGGGGAFLGFSMSPYQDLWFVGTDMGPLFRSIDCGANWQTEPTVNTLFFSNTPEDYTDLPAPGYRATPNTVFHAPAGGCPVISADGGITWKRSWVSRA